MRTFEAVNSDIKAAIDQFKSAMNGVENIVLWGLCDAASACSFFAPTDTRVKGLVLVNPWVRTEQGLAKALVTDYYWERLTSRSFWKKVLSGHFRIGESFTSFAKALGKLFSNQFSSRKPHTDTRKPDNKNSPPSAEELPIRVRNSIESFNGKSLLILSGNDLTAAEFINTTKADRKWRKLLKRPAFTHKTLKDADHTFSSRKWREDVCLWTVEWIETTLSKR
jgi:exosortase A-associated hydrolase 1